MDTNLQRIILGISGASGAIYARRLLDILDRDQREIHLIITEQARHICVTELGIAEPTPEALLGRVPNNVTFHDNSNMASPLASGSFAGDAMVICPCSSHSIASIGAGLANTLLLRSAYVSLKQRRPLILAHREMPLTAIDLENMLRITRAGGIVCPACPAFYNHPQTIDNLIDTVIGRLCDLLGCDHGLPIRYSP